MGLSIEEEINRICELTLKQSKLDKSDEGYMAPIDKSILDRVLRSIGYVREKYPDLKELKKPTSIASDCEGGVDIQFGRNQILLNVSGDEKEICSYGGKINGKDYMGEFLLN
ncbi:hypothetical protein COU57_05060 [Candidatus Pacearchaeota archaeon CG10_big_fil_rev_8_21_14_0_10_32_14]|nr:MAG: hypothetical protein COU57_05060 [Candidatus Pacearchaeota archaeon CG10_big_fil_rev_8_21_14_0_10_32_14]